MSYVSNLRRDSSGRYPGIGIAYTKLTREECEALKNAKVSVNTSNEHTEHDAQEATATYSDSRNEAPYTIPHRSPFNTLPGIGGIHSECYYMEPVNDELTPEECVALHRKLVREELEELERATRGSRINPAFYREFMKNYKAAKAKARIAHMFKEHDAQEATVIDAATDFDTRIKEITGVGHLFPARPVITFDELTYGKGARKCYVATISKVVTEGSYVIDLLNDIEFLVAGDFQAIPGVTYTVADYDTTTRKVIVTPLGE